VLFGIISFIFLNRVILIFLFNIISLRIRISYLFLWFRWPYPTFFIIIIWWSLIFYLTFFLIILRISLHTTFSPIKRTTILYPPLKCIMWFLIFINLWSPKTTSNIPLTLPMMHHHLIIKLNSILNGNKFSQW